MGTRENILLFVVAVLFALTFVIAAEVARFIPEGIRLIEICRLGNCVDTSPELFFIIAAIWAVPAIGMACAAWLLLRLNNVPRGYFLPIWCGIFAAVVAYLTDSGEEAVRVYFNSFLWLPVSLLLTGYLYLYLRWHYSRT